MEDNISGILASPGDYNIFAQEVIKLLKDDDLRKAMGKKARERVLSRFTWCSLGKEWLSAVCRVII